MALTEAQVAQLLDETAAHVVETKDVPWLSAGTAVRYWALGNREDVDACVAFLKKYTSVINFKAKTPSQTVENPHVDVRSPRAGTWQLLDVTWREEKNEKAEGRPTWKLYEALRLTGSGAESESRSQDNAHWREDSTAVLAQEAPVAAPAAHQGHIFDATDVWDRDTGLHSGRVAERTSKPWAIARTLTGRTVFEDVYAEVEGNQVEPATAGSGPLGTLYDADNAYNIFGTYDTRKGIRVARPASWSGTTRRTVFAERAEYDRRNQVGQTALQAFAAGRLVDLTSTLNAFGYYDEREAYTGLLAAGWSELTRSTAFADRHEYRRRNAAAQTAAQAFVAGRIVDLNSTLNEGGYYDEEEAYTALKAAAWSEVTRRTVFADRHEYRRRNVAGQTAAQAFVAGRIVDLNSTLNEGGYYDEEEAYTGLKAAAWSGVTRRTVFADRHEYRRRNLAAQTAAPGFTAGLVVDLTSTLNEGGYYDEEAAYTGLKAVTATETLEDWGVYGGVYRATYANAATPTAPANATRRAFRSTFVMNDGARYDGAVTEERRAPFSWGPILTTRHSGRREYEYGYEFQDAPVPVPAGRWGTARPRFDPVTRTWSTGLVLQVADTSQDIDWDGGRDFAFAFTARDGDAVNVYVKYTSSITTAEDHVTTPTSGYEVAGNRDGHRTWIDPVGRGKIMATRVEQIQ